MRARSIRIGALLLLAASVLSAAVPGTNLYLTSVGRGEGANSSMWYTTVWVYNPGDELATVTVSLLRRNQTNPDPEQQTITVAPGETYKLGDALLNLFGAEESAGALLFASNTNIVVSSRIYNLPAGAGLAESQGQFLAGTPATMAITAGEEIDIPGITQPVDGSFRCNFALVETGGANAEVTVTLLSPDGVELAHRKYSLGAYEPIQHGLTSLGSGLTVDGGRLNVRIDSGDGRVLAMASTVGNGAFSQDPSTLEMAHRSSSSVRTIKIPGNAFFMSDSIESTGNGLAMPADYRYAVTALLPMPKDWDGVSDMTLTVFFKAAGTGTEAVDFFVRVVGREAGEQLSDPGSISSTPVTLTGDSQALYKQSFTIPPSRLAPTDDVIHIYAIQRQGSAETYEGLVYLQAVEIAYNAKRWR